MRGRSVHARAVDFAADSQALKAFSLFLCSSSGLPEVGYAVITSAWVRRGVLTYRSSEERMKGSDVLCYVRVS
jgi:hypothetical protein